MHGLVKAKYLDGQMFCGVLLLGWPEPDLLFRDR
jgi:hypothetical protein